MCVQVFPVQHQWIIYRRLCVWNKSTFATIPIPANTHTNTARRGLHLMRPAPPPPPPPPHSHGSLLVIHSTSSPSPAPQPTYPSTPLYSMSPAGVVFLLFASSSSAAFIAIRLMYTVCIYVCRYVCILGCMMDCHKFAAWLCLYASMYVWCKLVTLKPYHAHIYKCLIYSCSATQKC